MAAEGGFKRGQFRPPKPGPRLGQMSHGLLGFWATLNTLVQYTSPPPSFLQAGIPRIGLAHRQVPQGPEQGPAHGRDE